MKTLVLLIAALVLMSGCKDNKCTEYKRGADHNICVQRVASYIEEWS